MQNPLKLMGVYAINFIPCGELRFGELDGIGVVAGGAAIILITQGPYVKGIAAHWSITCLHILQEGRGVCKTRTPLKLRDACLRAACALWPGLA